MMLNLNYDLLISIVAYPNLDYEHLISIAACLITAWAITRSIMHLVQKFLFVNKYKMYTDMLYFFLEKAYDMIYKTQIITYTSEGVHPAPNALETSQRDFVKLSRDLMGISNEKILTQFFGSKATLTNVTLLYFQERMDTDDLIDIVKQISKIKSDDQDLE